MKILTMTEWRTRVADTFGLSRISKRTAAEHSAAERRDIMDPVNSTTPSGRMRYSVYMQGYVQGLIDATRDRMWREDLEFCYVVDGVIYSTRRDSAHRKTEEFYARDAGCELSDAPCAHFWKGTDKPFTTIEPISRVIARSEEPANT